MDQSSQDAVFAEAGVLLVEPADALLGQGPLVCVEDVMRLTGRPRVGRVQVGQAELDVDPLGRASEKRRVVREAAAVRDLALGADAVCHLPAVLGAGSFVVVWGGSHGVMGAKTDASLDAPPPRPVQGQEHGLAAVAVFVVEGDLAALQASARTLVVVDEGPGGNFENLGVATLALAPPQQLAALAPLARGAQDV
jgi:hypothetical protein